MVNYYGVAKGVEPKRKKVSDHQRGRSTLSHWHIQPTFCAVACMMPWSMQPSKQSVNVTHPR